MALTIIHVIGRVLQGEVDLTCCWLGLHQIARSYSALLS